MFVQLVFIQENVGCIEATIENGEALLLSQLFGLALRKMVGVFLNMHDVRRVEGAADSTLVGVRNHWRVYN